MRFSRFEYGETYPTRRHCADRILGILLGHGNKDRANASRWLAILLEFVLPDPDLRLLLRL